MQTDSQVGGREEARIVFKGEERRSDGDLGEMAFRGEGGDFGEIHFFLGPAACNDHQEGNSI